MTFLIIAYIISFCSTLCLARCQGQNPVKVTSYSSIYPNDPSPHIREIADLLEELHNLFIDMRYLDPVDVAFAPHPRAPMDLEEAAAHGLTKNLVDLLQITPRVTTRRPAWDFDCCYDEEGWIDFVSVDRRILSGVEWTRNTVDPFTFLGMANTLEWLESAPLAGHDPSFLQAPGEPGVAPTSFGVVDGSRTPRLYSRNIWGNVLAYDTERNSIWLAPYKDVDPFLALMMPTLHGQPRPDFQRDGSTAHLPSMPAPDFLRLLIGAFKSLDWIPGNLWSRSYAGASDCTSWHRNLKKIYQESGWPDRFDPIKFSRLVSDLPPRFHPQPPRFGRQDKCTDAGRRDSDTYRPLVQLLDFIYHMRDEYEDSLATTPADRKRNWDEDPVQGCVVDSRRQTWQWHDEVKKRFPTHVDAVKEELWRIVRRRGRYTGAAWAGVGHDEYAVFAAKREFRDAIRIADLVEEERAEAGDVEAKRRLDARRWRVVKAAAREVPAYAWDTMEASFGLVWNSDSVKQDGYSEMTTAWRFLRGGRETPREVLERMLDEDWSVERLREELVSLAERQRAEWERL